MLALRERVPGWRLGSSILLSKACHKLGTGLVLLFLSIRNGSQLVTSIGTCKKYMLSLLLQLLSLVHNYALNHNVVYSVLVRTLIGLWPASDWLEVIIQFLKLKLLVMNTALVAMPS